MGDWEPVTVGNGILAAICYFLRCGQSCKSDDRPCMRAACAGQVSVQLWRILYYKQKSLMTAVVASVNSPATLQRRTWKKFQSFHG